MPENFTVFPHDSDADTGVTPGGAAGANKTWLAVFSGEIMRAYDQYNFMEGMIRTQTISSGVSFEYPITGTVALEAAWGAGEELGEGTSSTNTIAINLDNRPMAAHFEVDNVSRMVAQWDFAADLARQAGLRLANTRDQQLLAYVAKAAGEAVVTGDPQGLGSLEASISISDLFADLGQVHDPDADADARTQAALTFLQAIEDWLVDLQNRDLPTDRLYACVNPRAFQDIRALGVPRLTADLDTAPFALFGGAPDAGSAGSGYEKGFNVLSDALDYMGVKIIKSNHLPTTDVPTIGEAKYSLMGAYQSGGDSDEGICALMWHPDCIGGLSLQGMKMDSVADVRRNTQFTVASMLKGTGTLRPELARVCCTGTNTSGGDTTDVTTRATYLGAIESTAEFVATS